MTQLWMDGFDHYGGVANNMLNGPWAELKNVSLVPPPEGARTGPNALALGEATSGETFARRVVGAALDDMLVSVGFFTEFLPVGDSTIMPMQFRTAGNAAIASLTVRTDGAIELRALGIGGSVVGVTSGPVVLAGTWHHFEMQIVRHASAGTFELRVDETVVLNLSGLALGSTAISQVYMSRELLVDSPGIWLDDLILRDTAGAYNNDFEGDLRVATLQPIANGASQGWATRAIEKLGLGVMNFQDANRDMAITYADDPAFELGSGDYCIETFVRFASLLTLSEQATITGKHRATTNERSWRFYLNGPDVGGTLVFETSSDGTAGDEVEVHAFPFIPEVNRWYHLAVTRNGTDSRMFIDGQQVGITKTDSRTYDNNASRLYVNGRQNGASTSFDDESVDGWMDGYRLTVGASRYTANFAPPTSILPNDVGGDALYNSVELLLNFDTGPTVLDESSNAFAATLENAPFIQFPDDDVAYQTVDGLTPVDEDFVEAAFVPATETLTLTGQPLNTETVVLGATTYTFQTSLVDTANNVQIGADAEESLDNLLAAVNLEAGAGTKYGTGTAQNVEAFMVDLPDEQVLAQARVPGAAGNSIVTTETLTNGSWGDTTMSGGADIPGVSEFVMSNLPPEVTGVRAVAIIGRNFKTDSGASEVTMSFVEEGGSADAGTARPMTVNPTYYEDTFEEDPSTASALTPSTLVNSRVRLDRTT